jgi:glycosyltransferase involved in cell wall biosynthesis
MKHGGSEQGCPRVIIVHHFGPDPSETGGIESVLRTFEAELVGADAVKVHATRSGASRWRTASLALAAAWCIVRLKADAIVHVHMSERGSFVREGLLVILARCRALPVVITNHGAEFVEFATRHPRLVALVLKRADLILCLSAEAGETASRLAPRSSHRRVVNPVRTDHEAGPADATEEVVLFAGAIGTRKGVDVLTSAWPRVSAHRPQARLIIIGPASDFQVTPQERMEVLPAAPVQEIRRLIRDARVVVLPSRNEAMPVVLIEALAAGRPFISTAIAGIPLLADGIQALVPVGDHERLAEEIETLLADPGLARRRGDAGRALHHGAHSVEAVGSELRSAYLSALGRHGHRARKRVLSAWS